MILEKSYATEWIGNIKIKSYRVLSPEDKLKKGYSNKELKEIKDKHINKMLKKMGIVVPVRNENIDTIIGVISYIPSECEVVVVSNSRRSRFETEKQHIKEYFEDFEKNIKIIHQKDPELAKKFEEFKYNEILENKLVRDGKGEGLIIGSILALKDNDFVGFVDADNDFPGSVREYVKDYAAGFHLGKTVYSNVRLRWKSKPYLKGGKFVFAESGRTSKSTNYFMNRLISDLIGYDDEVIETGNAGEHAISKPLAEIMPFASGYEVEPYELIYLLEEFGGMESSNIEEEKIKKSENVEIVQIETMNPHLHRKGSEEHINKMTLGSLGTIYHSYLCNEDLKKEIEHFLETKNLPNTPPKPKIYPPIEKIDISKFNQEIESIITEV